MKISGAATLAFSPDLKWFQGNIVNSDNSEVYTITGKLILNSIEENDEYPGDSHNNNDGECSIDGLDIGCSRSNKLSPISEVCRLMLSWVTSIMTSGWTTDTKWRRQSGQWGRAESSGDPGTGGWRGSPVQSVHHGLWDWHQPYNWGQNYENHASIDDDNIVDSDMFTGVGGVSAEQWESRVHISDLCEGSQGWPGDPQQHWQQPYRPEHGGLPGENAELWLVD